MHARQRHDRRPRLIECDRSRIARRVTFPAKWVKTTVNSLQGR